MEERIGGQRQRRDRERQKGSIREKRQKSEDGGGVETDGEKGDRQRLREEMVSGRQRGTYREEMHRMRCG